MAHLVDAVGKPQDWDKAVSAAYLRLTGLTQKEAAKSAGIGFRTLQRWEVSPWWPDACHEASDRWLKGLVEVSQRTLYAAIDGGYANLAFRVTERRIPELAPPRIAHELFGKGGGAIEITSVEHNVTEADDEESE